MLNHQRRLTLPRPTAAPTATQLRVCLTLHYLWRQADYLQDAGWKTSAYGKWDAGMTTWGSTPTCRGFDHFAGFYSAATDYYDHEVGAGLLDLRNSTFPDMSPDLKSSGVYSTELYATRATQWITKQVDEHSRRPAADLKTFSYVATEAVHGPMDAPLRLYNGACAKLVGDQWPIRRTYCAMVRSLDEAVANITATYKALGLWEDTVVIMTADNGGIPADGGNNYPLRGNKATTYEGGVRGLGWIYGAGLSDAVKGTITHEMMHVVDWGTTIVAGIAQLPLTPSSRPVQHYHGLVMFFQAPSQTRMRHCAC